MLNDNANEALAVSKPYREMEEPDVSSIQEMNELVLEAISVSEKMDRNKTWQRKALQILLPLEKNAENLQQEYEMITRASKTLKNFPADLNVPRPDEKAGDFLQKTEKSLHSLQEDIHKSRNLIYQSKFKQAIKILKPLAEKDYPLNRLKQIKTNVEDAIRIARSMQKRSILAVQVAELLQKTKNTLFDLHNTTTDLENRVDTLQRKYPTNRGFPRVEFDYRSSLSRARSLRSRLQQAVNRVEKYLNAKDLKQALPILKEHIDAVEIAASLLPSMADINKRMISHLKKCQKIYSIKPNSCRY